MGLTFQEKSLWLMFVSLAGVFGVYFASVLETPSMDVLPVQVVRFMLAVILLVVTQVAGHLVIAILDRRCRTDERDRLIALKGTRNGAFVLATGVFLALCAAVLTKGNFVFTHLLLAFWVLAQLAEIGSQLYLYRKGA
jgi:hypothetical protein